MILTFFLEIHHTEKSKRALFTYDRDAFRWQDRLSAGKLSIPTAAQSRGSGRQERQRGSCGSHLSVETQPLNNVYLKPRWTHERA